MQKSIFIITDFKFKKNELVKIKSAFGKPKQYDHATFFNNEPQCLVENSTTNCLILNVLKKEQRGYISINLNNIKKNFILIIIMKSFQYSLLNNLGTSTARIKRNELIDTKILFTGTIATAAIYPRELVKSVLIDFPGTAAVIISHNHPSGSNTPSSPDFTITKKIKTALESIDVELLDHIILGTDFYSFSDHNQI